MKTVLLVGPAPDTEPARTLARTASNLGAGVLLVTGSSVSLVPQYSKTPELLIIDSPGADVSVGDGIVVFKHRSRSGGRYLADGMTCAVLDPSDSSAVKALGGKDIQTVTCGLSQKDTVTFSSIDSDGAVISLQRCVTTAGGTKIEPFEKPVRFLHHMTEYSVLATFASLILTGFDIKNKDLVL